MADEHDDWFRQAFGFDVPGAAQVLDGVQDRIVMIDLRPGELPRIKTDPGGMKGEGGLGLPWMPESVPDFSSEQGQAVVEGMGQPLVAGGEAVDAAASALQDAAAAVAAPFEAAAECADDVIPDIGRPLEASAEAIESAEQAVEQFFEPDPPAAPPEGGGAAGAAAGAQAGSAGAAGAAAGGQTG